jgi:hypothetical protein
MSEVRNECAPLANEARRPRRCCLRPAQFPRDAETDLSSVLRAYVGHVARNATDDARNISDDASAADAYGRAETLSR